MRLVLAIALILVGHRAAEAGKCKRGGTVLFREQVRPLKDAAVDTSDVRSSTFTIYASGAWERPGDEVMSRGCLAKKHLAALKQALAKAKFRRDTTGQGTCKAISTTEIVYTSPKRKKRVTTAAPCGPVLDEWTENLAICAQLAGEPTSLGDIVRQCRGEDPLM